MNRKWVFGAAVVMSTLMIAGCPTTDNGGGGGLPGDPSGGQPPTTLTVSAADGILQFSDIGAATQFPRSTVLSVQLLNPSAALVSVQWTIQVTGASFLAFSDANGNRSNTASGTAVTVTATASPATNTLHTVIASATLADNTVVTASVGILVTIAQNVSDRATSLQVNPFATPPFGTDASRQVVLDAGVAGETGSSTFTWSPVTALPPSNAADRIDIIGGLTNRTLTLSVVGNVSGVFPFQVIVRDGAGNIANAIVNVFLGITDIGLDVQTLRVQRSPSPPTVVLRTERSGGVPDPTVGVNDAFRYDWRVLDDSNSDVTAGVTFSPADLSFRDDAVNDWTVTNLPGAGVYRFILTVTDLAGISTTDSTIVWLADTLSLAVEASTQHIGLNTAFSLRTVRGGGEPNFRYTFRVLDTAGNDVTGSFAFTNGADTVDPVVGYLVGDASDQTWTLSGTGTPGSYRFFVTVSDDGGNAVTSSTDIVIGDFLALDLRANDSAVAPGESVLLTFDRTGGIGPFAYQYTITGPPGSADTFRTGGGLTNGTIGPNADDAALGVTAPAANAANLGAHRVVVTVTDSAGNTATDTLWLLVSAAGFSLDVQTSLVQVVPGQNFALRSVRNGGTPPVSYTWQVIDPTGASVADVPGSFGLNNAVDNAATIDWSATTPGAINPAGTYRFFLTATDANGMSATNSTEVLIAQRLELDVRSNAVITAPNIPVQISAVARGGGANGSFSGGSFVFTVTDAQGDSGVGQFGTVATSVAGGATTATIAYLPPANGSGVYNVTVTLTDGATAQQIARTIPIWLTRDARVAAGDAYNNALDLQTDLSTIAGAVQNALDFGAQTSPHLFVPTTTTLQEPRSLTMLVEDAGGALALAVNSVRVVGTNGAGHVIDETYSPVIGATLTTEDTPFKTVSAVVIDFTNGEAGDTIEIGVGEEFGLSTLLPTDSTAARQAIHVAAHAPGLDASDLSGLTFLTAGLTLGVTDPLRQFVLPTAQFPNGTTDYRFLSEPQAAIWLELSADDWVLSSGGAETAVLVADVSGGVAPYTYALDDIASGTGGAGTFTFTATQPGDLVGTYQAPAGIGSNQTYTLSVTVTDALGNSAVAQLPITIAP